MHLEPLSLKIKSLREKENIQKPQSQLQLSFYLPPSSAQSIPSENRSTAKNKTSALYAPLPITSESVRLELAAPKASAPFKPLNHKIS